MTDMTSDIQSLDGIQHMPLPVRPDLEKAVEVADPLVALAAEHGIQLSKRWTDDGRTRELYIEVTWVESDTGVVTAVHNRISLIVHVDGAICEFRKRHPRGEWHVGRVEPVLGSW